MKNILQNKRGEEVLTPIIIFVVLNVVFFSILFVFLGKASGGALVYEQAYSKQIAMLIDAADPEPSTVIWVNFVEGFEIAENDNLNKSNLITIQDNHVIVNLGRSKGGYGTRFFSDYDVSFYEQGRGYNIVINKEREKNDEN